MDNLKEYKMYINGEWVNSSDGKIFNSLNPAEGEPWAIVQAASPDDVKYAINSANDAQKEWSTLTFLERANHIENFVKLLKQPNNTSAVALTETTDWGRQLKNSLKAVNTAARYANYYIHASDHVKGSVNSTDDKNIFNYELREPLGVIGAIVPWNAPTVMAIDKIIPAIIMGNTIVIKPSEHCSVPLLEMAELMRQAGFPKGVVNVVTGDEKVGEALVSSPDVNKIAFTGSVKVAKRIAQFAIQHLKPCLFELGGKSPNIVFNDAAIKQAVNGAILAFRNMGQTCIAPTRLLLQDDIYEGFVKDLVKKCKTLRIGVPLDNDSDLGPLATKVQLDKVQRYIEIGRSEGATEVLGDSDYDKSKVNPNGYYIGPTIFANANNKMRIAQEEIFGPVLTVIPFKYEEEAIVIANDTNYGLAAGVWTKDLNKAHRVARQLQAGTVWVNTYHEFYVQTPFGGYKDSGNSRERGLDVLNEYSQKKNVLVRLQENNE